MEEVDRFKATSKHGWNLQLENFISRRLTFTQFRHGRELERERDRQTDRHRQTQRERDRQTER